MLNKARDDAGNMAQGSLRDTNNVVRMVTAGSKGSFINISQARPPPPPPLGAVDGRCCVCGGGGRRGARAVAPARRGAQAPWPRLRASLAPPNALTPLCR